MPKYVLAYHGGGVPQNEADQAAVMQSWMSWFEALGSAVVDGGNPTGQSKTIGSSGAVSDGGGANPISGYSLIDATDIDAAVTLAKGCPILQAGGAVEIAETIDM